MTLIGKKYLQKLLIFDKNVQNMFFKPKNFEMCKNMLEKVLQYIMIVNVVKYITKHTVKLIRKNMQTHESPCSSYNQCFLGVNTSYVYYLW